jgi:hypothetical protein
MSGSICSRCKNARKPWSDELRDSGHYGCTALYAEKSLDGIIAEIKATGWVDLREWPEGKGSGAVINDQLIVRGVTKCPHFEARS